MGDVQPVLVLVGLEHHIQPVRCVGHLPLGDENQVLRVLGPHLLIALLDMAPECRVDFDDAPLAGLLFKEDESVPGTKVAPFQTQNITDPQTKKYPTPNQERDGEVPIIVKPVHKGDGLIPFQGLGCCV